MRWLAVHPGPQFSVHDVFVGWVEALREVGESVVTFDLDTRLAFYDNAYMMLSNGNLRKAVTGPQAIQLATNGLAAMLYKVRPEVLFIISGFFVDADLLEVARRQGTTIVVLNTESPYEEERQLKLAEHVDLVLLNDPIHIEAFREKTNAVYAPHAFRPSVHYPGETAIDPVDFSFVGTGYPSRVAFLEAMGFEGLNAVLAGNWQRLTEGSPLRRYLGHKPDECIDNAQAAELYRATRVGMNLYRREADDSSNLLGWSMGPREVEMAACGLFFLRDPRPESDEVLSMLPTFESPEEARQKVNWYLARPSLRQELARSARQAVELRTFKQSARMLLRLFERQPVTVNGG